MKKTLVSLAAAVAFAGTATAAFAIDVYPLGDLQDTAKAIGGLRTGTFWDEYEFTITLDSIVAAAAVSTGDIDIPLLPGIEYSAAIETIRLLDASDNIVAFDNDGSNGFSIVSGVLSAGTYRVAVIGDATGTLGGSYGGVIQTVGTAPVPEPETWALMLGGLGALGFLARRRKVAA